VLGNTNGTSKPIMGTIVTYLLEYVAKINCIKNEMILQHGKMGGIGICTMDLNMEMAW
jgi:nicotinamide mononucleotide (NMN) deamidase PncC